MDCSVDTLLIRTKFVNEQTNFGPFFFGLILLGNYFILETIPGR